MLASETRVTVVIGALVLIAQCAFLISTYLVLNHYGASLAQLTSGMDSEYIPLAHAILDEGQFQLPKQYYPAEEPFPETFRTPGYPIYITGIFTLFGGSRYHPKETAPPDTAFYALLFSLTVLASLTAALIYQIGREIGMSTMSAAIAAILFGLSPAVIFIPVSGMGSDMLFVLLFTLALYLVLRLPHTSRPRLAVLTFGLALGWSVLTRPSGLFLSLVVLIALPFLLGGGWKRHMQLWLIGCIGFIAVLSPWYARNYAVTGHFDLSSIPVYNAFNYNIPEFYLYRDGTPLNTTRNQLFAPIGDPNSYRVRSFEHTDALATVAKSFLRENFASYAVFHILKTAPFFLGSGLDVQYAVIDIAAGGKLNLPFFPNSHENLSSLLYQGDVLGVLKNLLTYWPATLERVTWAALFTLTLVAPFVSKGRVRRFFILGLILIGLSAILASPVAQPRYRIPVEPFIWLGALYSASVLIRMFPLRRLLPSRKTP